MCRKPAKNPQPQRVRSLSNARLDGDERSSNDKPAFDLGESLSLELG
jgi:hypothetical protein